MKLIFLSLCSIFCSTELFVSIKSQVERLHKFTNSQVRTYYELFGVDEDASEAQIKKAFRFLQRRTVIPFGMTKTEHAELVSTGLNLLTKQRNAYKSFLKDSTFMYLTEDYNFQNSFSVKILAVIAFLIFLDLIVFAFKYLKYLEKYETRKKEKGKKAVLDAKMPSSVIIKCITVIRKICYK